MVVFTGSIADAAKVFSMASFIAWFIIVIAMFSDLRVRDEERAKALAMWTCLSGMLWLGSIRHVFLPLIRNSEVVDSLTSIFW